MLIAATSDIHFPKGYENFLKSIDKMIEKPDLFLLAGDIVNNGNLSEFDKFYNIIFGKFNCPIISCFGNTELPNFREDVKKRYKDIKFLEDESFKIDIKGKSVGIFGTTGSLEQATSWQKINIPDIEKIYEKRIQLTESILREMKTDFKILLMHYVPTFKTLEGENPKFYSTMGSRTYENIINNQKPNIVIHGHSHFGIKTAWLNSIPIYNVSFPVNKDIVFINTDKIKPGLTKFL